MLLTAERIYSVAGKVLIGGPWGVTAAGSTTAAIDIAGAPTAAIVVPTRAIDTDTGSCNSSVVTAAHVLLKGHT